MKKLILLFFSTLLISCFKEPTKLSTTNIKENITLPPKPLKTEDTLIKGLEEVVENKIKNSIVLFSNVNGIYPNKSSFNDVKFILGDPDYIDTNEVTIIDGNYFGGNKLAKYKKLGIMLVFPTSNENIGTIDAVYVEENFDGISEEGIYIGMNKEKCLNILNKKYYFRNGSNNNYYYSLQESEKAESQFVFKNDLLILIRIG